MVKLPRSTFAVYAVPAYCQCEGPRSQVYQGNSREKAIQTALAHWSVITVFYGYLTPVVHITVVDTRDGVVQWRNGKLIEGAQHGKGLENHYQDGGDGDS